MSLHWGGKLMAGALVATLAFGTALDANAKRMGGSRSVGKQSSTVTQRQQTPPATTPSPTQRRTDSAAVADRTGSGSACGQAGA